MSIREKRGLGSISEYGWHALCGEFAKAGRTPQQGVDWHCANETTRFSGDRERGYGGKSLPESGALMRGMR